MAADPWITVEVDDDNELATLRVQGDVDIATAGTLYDTLERVIDNRTIDSDTGSVIIELGGVGFIGIAGIRVLVEAAGRLGVDGRRLVLLGSRPEVSRILELWQQEGGPAPWTLGCASDRPSSQVTPTALPPRLERLHATTVASDRRIADSGTCQHVAT